ncbi:MAG: hypothetical protein IJZ08_05570 [Clostridia bacterium]|nr:hypothetical protein [Clostridia bacterium]
MKRILLTVLGLILICLFIGCASEPGTPDINEQNTDETTDTGTVSDTAISTPAESQPSECVSDVITREIVSITDTTQTQNADLPDVEEPFYEDRQYVYIFGNPISKYVIVEYTDGTSENVKDALEAGHVALYDLDRFGIQYFAEPKLIEDIIDHAESGEYATDEALEGFYSDEKYLYYFPSIRSQYVIVYFRDGTEMPIREALAAGTVKIHDLDWFGIQYYKEERE